MAELKELAEFYARAAAMKEPVFRLKGFVQDRHVPTISSDISNWTVEERQPDFQCLIDSGIDCEFSDDGHIWQIGKLKQINGSFFVNHRNAHCQHCRPRLNHIHAWIATEDSKCPVPDGYKVKAYFAVVKGAPFSFGLPGEFDWSITDINRIVAFEVLPL